MHVPVGQWSCQLSCVAASLKKVPCSAAVTSHGYILMSLTTGLFCFTLGLYAGVNMTKWWERNVSSDVLTQCGISGVFDGYVPEATFVYTRQHSSFLLQCAHVGWIWAWRPCLTEVSGCYEEGVGLICLQLADASVMLA